MKNKFCKQSTTVKDNYQLCSVLTKCSTFVIEKVLMFCLTVIVDRFRRRVCQYFKLY